MDDATFVHKLKVVISEAMTWLVNSTADVNKVDWHVSPIHILVGGNKLDRGFTVEGLTVTYMNRPASPQVDTLEQRARAFGYRGDLLPYCQFFASKKTDPISDGGRPHRGGPASSPARPRRERWLGPHLGSGDRPSIAGGNDANPIERGDRTVDDGAWDGTRCERLRAWRRTPPTTTPCLSKSA